MSMWQYSHNCIVGFTFNHMIKFEFIGSLHINEVTKCMFTMLEPHHIDRVNDIDWGVMQIKIMLEAIVPVMVIEN